jgi:hypothetical protein
MFLHFTSFYESWKRALVVQLQTGKNGFNAFLYQVRLSSVLSPLYICGHGHQIAKHIIIHCQNISAARHDLGDIQGCPPDYK